MQAIAESSCDLETIDGLFKSDFRAMTNAIKVRVVGKAVFLMRKCN
jgi:hypothetical protein